MIFEIYSHRFAEIILNSDFQIRKEIDLIIKRITFDDVIKKFNHDNLTKNQVGKKVSVAKQSTINTLFREEFIKLGWDTEKNVFDDPENDLIIDFWKRDIGLDVAFNHRSFIGGDLLRFQAASEVKNIIKLGIYICPKKSFAKIVSPKDGSSMVNFERSVWYLQTLFQVLTVPILLIGLTE